MWLTEAVSGTDSSSAARGVGPTRRILPDNPAIKELIRCAMKTLPGRHCVPSAYHFRHRDSFDPGFRLPGARSSSGRVPSRKARTWPHLSPNTPLGPVQAKLGRASQGTAAATASPDWSRRSVNMAPFSGNMGLGSPVAPGSSRAGSRQSPEHGGRHPPTGRASAQRHHLGEAPDPRPYRNEEFKKLYQEEHHRYLRSLRQETATREELFRRPP